MAKQPRPTTETPTVEPPPYTSPAPSYLTGEFPYKEVTRYLTEPPQVSVEPPTTEEIITGVVAKKAPRPGEPTVGPTGAERRRGFEDIVPTITEEPTSRIIDPVTKQLRDVTRTELQEIRRTAPSAEGPLAGTKWALPKPPAPPLEAVAALLKTGEATTRTEALMILQARASVPEGGKITGYKFLGKKRPLTPRGEQLQVGYETSVKEPMGPPVKAPTTREPTRWIKVSSGSERALLAEEYKQKYGEEIPINVFPYKRTLPRGEVEYRYIPTQFKSMDEYEKALREYKEYEAHKEELRVMAQKDPLRYWGTYVSSAWAHGPITAMGIGARTITRGFIGAVSPEERERMAEEELTSITQRTLGLEKEPVKTILMGEAQVPILYGTSYLAGAAQTKLATTAALGEIPKWVPAGVSAVTKIGGAGIVTAYVAPPILEGKPVEAVGRVAEVGASIPIAYTGAQAGAKWMLIREYPKLLVGPDASPAELARAKMYVETAVKAGQIDFKAKPSSIREAVKKTQGMGGKVGDVTADYLIQQRSDIKMGGSTGAQTQIDLGRELGDIDLYTDNPKQQQQILYEMYQKAGIDSYKKGHTVKTYTGSSVSFSHTSKLTEQIGYAGTVKTPEGVQVIDVKGQLIRKAGGPFEDAWRVKDFGDFDRMVSQILTRGTIAAEKSPPIISGFKLSKVEALKRMFSEVGRKGTAYGDVDIDAPPTPTFIPYTSPKYAKPEKPKVYPPVVPTERYAPTTPQDIDYTTITPPPTEYPQFLIPQPKYVYKPRYPSPMLPAAYPKPGPPPEPKYPPYKAKKPKVFMFVTKGLKKELPSPLGPRKVKRKKAKVKLKVGEPKLPEVFAYPDPVSAAISQARYGVATAPKFKVGQVEAFRKQFYAKVPTKEMITYG